MLSLSEISQLLVGMAGFGGGMGLAYLAQEEWPSLQQPLRWIQLVLLAFIIATLGYELFFHEEFLSLALLFVIAIVSRIFSWKKKPVLAESLIYGTTSFFFFQQPAVQPLLASLLFLYGLPTGTLLWHQTWKAPSKKR